MRSDLGVRHLSVCRVFGLINEKAVNNLSLMIFND